MTARASGRLEHAHGGATADAGGDLPRLVIERSAGNDIRVILSALLPSEALVAAMSDPAAVLKPYTPELRSMARMLRTRLEASGHVDSDQTDRDRDDQEPPRVRATGSRELGSLLR